MTWSRSHLTVCGVFMKCFSFVIGAQFLCFDILVELFVVEGAFSITMRSVVRILSHYVAPGASIVPQEEDVGAEGPHESLAESVYAVNEPAISTNFD